MRIAVSATGKDLNSQVDSRFSRAHYFIIVDTERDGFIVSDNTQNVNALQGAGIQAAKNVADMNVQAVITGNLGPKAFATLQAAGIDIYTGFSGTVGEAVEALNSGKLLKTSKPSVEGHWT